MFKEHREPLGLIWRVEPIGEVLTRQYGVKISPSGYYAFKSRPISRRAIRDEERKAKILDTWKENYSCWGVTKVWRALLKHWRKCCKVYC